MTPLRTDYKVLQRKVGNVMGIAGAEASEGKLWDVVASSEYSSAPFNSRKLSVLFITNFFRIDIDTD